VFNDHRRSLLFVKKDQQHTFETVPIEPIPHHNVMRSIDSAINLRKPSLPALIKPLKKPLVKQNIQISMVSRKLRNIANHQRNQSISSETGVHSQQGNSRQGLRPCRRQSVDTPN